MPEWLEQQIVLALTQIFDAIGWGGVVGIMALESANIPIPSEVTMPLAGWLLVQGRGAGPWSAALAYGGFVFGAHWVELRAIMRPFDIPIAIILVAGLIYYLAHHIRRGRRTAHPEISADAP